MSFAGSVQSMRAPDPAAVDEQARCGQAQQRDQDSVISRCAVVRNTRSGKARHTVQGSATREPRGHDTRGKGSG